MSAAHPEMDLTVGNYRIIRKLGQGGMGEVYLAEDPRLRRPVAIKILQADRLNDEDMVRRFEKEAQTVSTLNHPNILVIHEIGADGDRRYLVTEYIEGETLRQRARNGPLPVPQVLDIGIQVAGALQTVHAAGIYHRDLKPDNIMIRPDGYVKILDFGLAKLAAQNVEEDRTMTVISRDGFVVGTVPYMSPEQIRGLEIDGRSDIFSLGAVLYEIATGESPFHGGSMPATLAAILERRLALAHEKIPGAPDELSRIFEKALAKSREERYASAGELLADLKALKKQVEFESHAADSGYVFPARGATAAGNREPTSSGRVELSATISADAIQSRPAISRRSWLALAGSAIATAGAAGYWFANKAPARYRVVAVLPFQNGTGDPGRDYFSDGLTQNLTNALSRMQPLQVIARGRVSKYRDKSVDPKVAGRELGADAMVTGGVSERDGNLAVSVELLDTARGSQVWGYTYHPAAAEVSSLEANVERDLVAHLGLRPSSEQIATIRADTKDTDAYNLYLKGRHALNRVSLEGRRAAIQFFTEAVQKDPRYAPAWAGLARATSQMAFSDSPLVWMPKAREAAQKAIDLDPTLAEAQLSLGWVAERFEWNWKEAEALYLRALSLNPRDADASTHLAQYYMRLAQWDKAMRYAQRAVELVPENTLAMCDIGWIYYHERDFERAIDPVRNALAVDKDMVWGHTLLGSIYRQRGMFAEAIIQGRVAVQASGDPLHRSGLARSLAAAGQTQEARSILDDLIAQSQQRYVSPYYIAWIYAALKDRESTFAWLEKSLAEHNVNMIYVRIEPEFDFCHGDRRYEPTLRAMRLL